MKKKLIFCICILLSIIMGFSVVPFSAYSYECPVEVESASVLIVNLDTETVVFEKHPETAHFISYLSNLMTFIVACNNTEDYQTKVSITDEVLSNIPNSDGGLDIYRGKTLTVQDLLYFIMLTNGNDACYVLADHVTKGDRDAFVAMMNQKARELGCKKTKFSSVAARNDTTHFSNCTDLYKILKYALEMPEYLKEAAAVSYQPKGYNGEKYLITTTNSLIKSKSPYYFRYTINGKYGADSIAKGNLIAVSEYADVHYACIILGAQQLSEQNAFTEAKQLLTWAYTKLGNKQIVSSSTVLANTTAKAPWGEVSIELTSGKDIVKTVPAEYTENKIKFVPNDLDETKLPVFKGQNVGTAQVYYDDKPFDEIDLIAGSSHGVSMLSDVSSFFGAAINRTITPAKGEATDETKATQAETKSAQKETVTTQAE